jgi:hypothetical protein
MIAYYNEHNRFAAAWLRELIADGQGEATYDISHDDPQGERPKNEAKT